MCIMRSRAVLLSGLSGLDREDCERVRKEKEELLQFSVLRKKVVNYPFSTDVARGTSLHHFSVSTIPSEATLSIPSHPVPQ